MPGRSPQRSAHRRYHFHFPGVLYVLVTLLVAVGAINSQNNLLFGALGLAIGGLLVSGVLSGSGLLGLRVERAGHGTAAVGKPLVLRYRLRNTNSLMSAFAMHLDEVRRGVSNWHRFFPAVHTFVTQVRAGSEFVAETGVVPERRGVARFELVQLWTKFPFGLARKSMTFAAPLEVIVQPPDLPLRPGLIRRITARAPYGLGGTRSAGLGEEFFALREYVAGDNPKLIAWKRSARTGTLIVRQRASPAPTRLWIVIRFGRSDTASAAIDERAIALAAAVAREASSQQIAVGLAVPGAEVVHSPRVGRVHLEMLLGDLAILDLEKVRAPGAQRLPETALRTGACIIIHAGEVDESYGPRGSTHWAAADARNYFQPSPETERVLGLFDRGPQREQVERSRKLRRFWVRRRRIRKEAGA
jgi:uncharacterized protein (DUF58 family)